MAQTLLADIDAQLEKWKHPDHYLPPNENGYVRECIFRIIKNHTGVVLGPSAYTYPLSLWIRIWLPLYWSWPGCSNLLRILGERMNESLYTVILHFSLQMLPRSCGKGYVKEI